MLWEARSCATVPSTLARCSDMDSQMMTTTTWMMRLSGTWVTCRTTLCRQTRRARPMPRFYAAADRCHVQDADDDLNELITREYHFGGDEEEFFTKKATPTVDEDGEPGDPARKSKKEVMAEIIAKSKASKRERAQEREADEEQLEELDTRFKELADVRHSLTLTPAHGL